MYKLPVTKACTFLQLGANLQIYWHLKSLRSLLFFLCTSCLFFGGGRCNVKFSAYPTAPKNVKLNVLESHPLQFYGEACLEFWYLAPAASNGSELHVLLKTNTSLVEIWNSPALPRNAWRQVTVPLNISEPDTKVKDTLMKIKLLFLQLLCTFLFCVILDCVWSCPPSVRRPNDV